MGQLTDIQILLIIFVFLQIKHFLADFVFQTDKMIREKGTYGSLFGIYHSAIHGIGTGLIFFFIHPLLGLLTAILDFIAHYHIDWAKININKKYNYEAKNREFWIWLGLDQLAHQLTYVILVGWAFFAF